MEKFTDRSKTEGEYLPPLVAFTERVNEDSDPVAADRNADGTLIFLSIGVTILGAMAGAILYLTIVPLRHPAGFSWIVGLLLATLGGSACASAVMIWALDLRGMISWEKRLRSKDKTI